MRIGLNLLHARPEMGGGWNYIQNLVGTLGDNDHKNEYFCYCTRSSEGLVPSRENFRRLLFPRWVGNQYGRILCENSILNVRAVREKLDVLHWFGNVRSPASCVKDVVTIYDLGAFDGTGGVSLTRQLYARILIPYSVRTASVLAPMSRTTADSVVERFHVNPQKCIVIPTPISQVFSPCTADSAHRFRLKYQLAPRFWLYVAHCYPHKNHLRLLEAYRVYLSNSSDPWPLVLRGKKLGLAHILEAEIRRHGIERHVRWLPELDSDEMPLLYSAAGAVVFPSLYEGGGIPVLEAMACGCPVIASRIPTTSEFAGDAALTFDAERPNEIAEAMLQFGNNDQQRELHRNRGLSKVPSMRREAIYPRIIQAYEMAVGS